MSGLTLPGSIPGLLRRGSPVVIGDGPAVVVALEAPSSLYELSVAHICTPGNGVKYSDWKYTVRSLALDLTDATGRAHAAWWLAAQHGEPSPTTEVWDFCPETTSRDVRDAEGNHLDLIDGGPALWLCGANGWTAGDAPLADLDPNDSRLLPDGSRWVDAEALRRVCLHVAGLVQ